jgi:hypothetical protein
VKIGLDIRSTIATTQFDNRNALPRPIQSRREIVEFCQFKGSKRRAGSMRADANTGSWRVALEVRFGDRAIVNAKDPFDNVG